MAYERNREVTTDSIGTSPATVFKTPRSQGRGPRFNPCSGNQIPHAATKTQHSRKQTSKKQNNVVKKKKNDSMDLGLSSQLQEWSCHLLVRKTIGKVGLAGFTEKDQEFGFEYVKSEMSIHMEMWVVSRCRIWYSQKISGPDINLGMLMKIMRLKEITQEVCINKKQWSGLNPEVLQGWEDKEGVAKMTPEETVNNVGGETRQRGILEAK